MKVQVKEITERWHEATASEEEKQKGHGSETELLGLVVHGRLAQQDCPTLRPAGATGKTHLKCINKRPGMLAYSYNPST